MGFVVGAYQAVEQIGVGHRAAPAVLWRGAELRSLYEIAMIVMPVEQLSTVLSEVEAVAEIRHPHLLPVIEVAEQGNRVAVVHPWPAGGRLAELMIRRGRLSVPETLTVLIPLASALAAAHAAGIRHGGVAPEAVWFDSQGRPLLGPISVGRVIAELNDGMPVECRDVAPEVVRGERLHHAPLGPASDVFSLGSIALRCLTGRSAWPADDPTDVLIQSAAGLWPDPPDDAGPAELVELVRSMLHDDPDRRPDAAELATSLRGMGEPAPLDFGAGPVPVPASANRWRGFSGVQQDPEPGGAAEPGPKGGSVTVTPADTGQERSSAPVAQDRSAIRARAAEQRADLRRRVLHPEPGDRPQITEPERLSSARRAGIALLVGLLITVVAVQVSAWWSGRDQPGIEAEAAPNWPDVVAELDAARARALASADPELLDEVYQDRNSPSAAADAATIDQLAQRGWRVVDGVHEIISVTRDESATGGPEPSAAAAQVTGDDARAGPVRLAVVDVLPARSIVDTAGVQVGVTQARAEQRRVLVVGSTAAGYRILAVEAG
jgi:hypothetical protein